MRRIEGVQTRVQPPGMKSVRRKSHPFVGSTKTSSACPPACTAAKAVALAMDAQLVDIVAGEPDDWPDVENVRSPGVPTATVDCHEVDQVRGEFLLLIVWAISMTDPN